MHDITKSPYFFYGSASVDEDTEILTQYALYDYVSNRFVITSRWIEPLRMLAILFSSRLHLRVCSLHYAENFSPGLIDNVCCTSWGIADRGRMKIAESIRTILDNRVLKVTLLGEQGPADPDELIIQNIEYLLAAYSWITDRERGDNAVLDFFRNKGAFMETELQLMTILELPMPIAMVTKDMKELLNVIYTEFDLKVAEKRRQDLMNR